MRFLVEKGANIHAKSQLGGYTVLFYAVIKGSLADVRYLVDKGADANDKNDGDRTVLMDAVTRNDPEMVRFLIERGADVKIRTAENNCCVLGEAARWANAEIVQLLLEHGADVNNVDTMGMTPLLYAATHDNVEAAQILIENGANLEARERYKGFTLCCMPAICSSRKSYLCW